MDVRIKWAGAAVFLVIYGLAVFVGTRAYYSAGSTAPASAPPSLPGDHPDVAPKLRPFPLAPQAEDLASVMERADASFRDKDYAAAADGYRRALELASGNAEIHNNLGLTLFYLGRTDEALEVLQRGAAVDPNVQRLWLTLGFVQSNAQRTDEARASLQKAIDLGPDNEIGQEARRMLELTDRPAPVR